MRIPIENIYYLLCYAWNKLDEKERVNVSIDDQTELLDLFAKVLINGTNILLKRGIDKSYLDFTEEIAGIKGKIQISQTIKSNLLFKQKTICTFDDLSTNILTNQILLTTINFLTKTIGVTKELKMELHSLQRMFHGVDLIQINNSLFKQITLNRNNRFYGFLLNVCQIIFEHTLPSEKPGIYKFQDFTRDDRKMNQLFEAFIRNFFKIEQNKFNVVKKEIIHWQFQYSESDSFSFIPRMETDITLENNDEKIIIDAKYYRETMSTYFDNEKIKSGNIYQLFSYLINQEDSTEKNYKTKGILLYPVTEKEYFLKYQYKNHPIEIRTINLNSNWKKIEEDLLKIVL